MMMGKNTRYIVLGFPRSGTTLLARLLDAHPDISCPPETFAFAGAGRFLSEQERVEGPPIGALTGLGMLGIEAEDIMTPLRDMVFGFQEKIAGTCPIWVEKTAANIFHIEALEPFLEGHVRYIYMVRNPLDVVASNMDLAHSMGAQLSDLFAMTRGSDIPQEGIMRAWVDRTHVLDDLAERCSEDCHVLRYEDLAENPKEELRKILEFIDLEGDIDAQLEGAFSNQGQIGLGDFRIDETNAIHPPEKNGWRKRLPRAVASRIIPLAAELMARHGYEVPKAPKIPDRETAIRQYRMATEMKRNIASKK